MTKPAKTDSRPVIPLEAFDLRKAKVNKEGVYVEFHEGGTDPGINKKDGDYQPHPDLQDSLDGLKNYMAQCLGILEGWDFARENLKENSDALEEAMRKYEATIDLCKVNGITILGDGESKGVKITGSLKTPGGGSTGLATPKITFGQSKLGYEVEVETLVEKVVEEVYKYRFNGKKLQTSILDPDQNGDKE